MKGSRDPNGPWMLQLVCCGRDGGVERFATWEDADVFRADYADAGGHERAAILTNVPFTAFRGKAAEGDAE